METFLVHVKKDMEFLIKMKMSHVKKLTTYPYQYLNTLKGMVRSQEPFLYSLEKKKKELKSQGATETMKVNQSVGN